MVLASIFFRLPPCQTIHPIDRHNFNGEPNSFGVPEIFWNWSFRHHQFWWCGKPNNILDVINFRYLNISTLRHPQNQDFSGLFFAIPSAGGQCSHQGKSEQTGAVLGRLGWTWTRGAWLLGGRVMGGQEFYSDVSDVIFNHSWFMFFMEM